MLRTCWFTSLAALVAVSVASVASAATLVEVARFDVSGATADSADPNFIGNNPSAVAWDGTRLFVAGFNSSGGNAQTAIIEVTNAGATGLNAAAFGTAFGALTTPNLRGYSGLDVRGGVLAAAYDDGGADPNGIQAFDAANSQLWAKSARGGSGVAFDPGFSGDGAGVAWTTFGSGRRALQDTATGADIYTTGDGMIINDSSIDGGSFWRDMDFDPTSGDIYARRSNAIIKSTRTGANSVTGTTSLVPVDTSANFVNGQMVSFLSDTLAGDLLIYNDRATGGTGQAFADVVKLMTPDGAAEAASFVLLDGGPVADGNGYYDFDYDVASGTVALMDFANRNVHIFSIVPEPASAMTLGLGLLLAAARRRV
ncbi:PEP-CTERM sorting domain-containing protein [Botrimarina sp.]|uniref:PEP-CTERM sorting domain-containing protein n=1 Tax=Botrimarina sp. TaxID=2795802 RepID=UPI0032EFB551